MMPRPGILNRKIVFIIISCMYKVGVLSFAKKVASGM